MAKRIRIQDEAEAADDELRVRAADRASSRPTPSAKGLIGRDPVTGKFLKGCQPGPGNPLIAKIAEYRSMMFTAVTVEEFTEVFRKLMQLAKGGDLAAMRVVFDRLLGRVPVDLELQLAERGAAYDPNQKFI